MNPTLLRRIELFSGLGAALLAIVGPAFGLLTNPQKIAADFGGGSNIIVWAGTVAAVAMGTLIDSLLRDPLGGLIGTSILWTSVGLLWVLVVMPYPSIDPYLLPSAILGLIAGIADLWSRTRETESRPARG